MGWLWHGLGKRGEVLGARKKVQAPEFLKKRKKFNQKEKAQTTGQNQWFERSPAKERRRIGSRRKAYSPAEVKRNTLSRIVG